MKKVSKKSVVLALAIVMLVGGAASGTLAWLTSESETVTNVFTTSDINVSLDETKDEFKMIPGWTIEKDPIVTVEAGSEDCWVFLEVEEEAIVSYVPEGETMPVMFNFRDFICYEIDENNWTELPGEDGVYCCYANDITSKRDIKVLAGGTYSTADGVDYTWEPNQVLTKPEVTKEMMNAVADGIQPTLSFKVYATQYWKNNTEPFEVDEAWQLVQAQK